MLGYPTLDAEGQPIGDEAPAYLRNYNGLIQFTEFKSLWPSIINSYMTDWLRSDEEIDSLASRAVQLGNGITAFRFFYEPLSDVYLQLNVIQPQDKIATETGRPVYDDLHGHRCDNETMWVGPSVPSQSYKRGVLLPPGDYPVDDERAHLHRRYLIANVTGIDSTSDQPYTMRKYDKPVVVGDLSMTKRKPFSVEDFNSYEIHSDALISTRNGFTFHLKKQPEHPYYSTAKGLIAMKSFPPEFAHELEDEFDTQSYMSMQPDDPANKRRPVITTILTDDPHRNFDDMQPRPVDPGRARRLVHMMKETAREAAEDARY